MPIGPTAYIRATLSQSATEWQNGCSPQLRLDSVFVQVGFSGNKWHAAAHLDLRGEHALRVCSFGTRYEFITMAVCLCCCQGAR